MIVIAGLGIAGSYLFRRLSEAGFEVSAYDPKVSGFYVPCGYATNGFRLGNLISRVGLDVGDYVERDARRIIISGPDGREFDLSPAGLCTIDKNRLEGDLIGELSFSRSRAPGLVGENNILIDATGVSRYYLGKAKGDLLMHTKEYLSPSATHEDFYFRYFSSGSGYYWEFPLSSGYHVGAGGDSAEMVKSSTNWVKEPVKTVSRKIRLSPLFDSMFRDNTIGVGEAIGTVSPITGEGILPSMESAEILFQQLKAHDSIEEVKANYRKEIMKTFSRFTRLFELLTDARNGDLKKLRNISALRSAREDFENFGIKLSISRILRQLVLT